LQSVSDISEWHRDLVLLLLLLDHRIYGCQCAHIGLWQPQGTSNFNRMGQGSGISEYIIF
jgi:hypothetical protein